MKVYGVLYSGYTPILERFSNVSWISNENYYFINEWTFLIGKSVIFVQETNLYCGRISELYYSRGKGCVVMNSMLEIPLILELLLPIGMHCDNKSKVYNGVKDGIITIDYVEINFNIEKWFTKALCKHVWWNFNSIRLLMLNKVYKF